MPYKDLEVRRQYQNGWARKYRAKNRDKLREYRRLDRLKNRDKINKRIRERQRNIYRNSQEYREKLSISQKSYYIRHRERILESRRKDRKSPENIARQAVYIAIKRGKIIKPTKCSKCSSGNRIEAHHPNYSEKLNVIWLCSFCHRQLHRKD